VGETIRRERNTCTLLTVIQIGTTMMETSLEFPQRIKDRATISSSNPASRSISEKKEIYLHSSVHCTMIMSIDMSMYVSEYSLQTRII
jgi:hypothetical protein